METKKSKMIRIEDFPGFTVSRRKKEKEISFNPFDSSEKNNISSENEKKEILENRKKNSTDKFLNILNSEDKNSKQIFSEEKNSESKNEKNIILEKSLKKSTEKCLNILGANEENKKDHESLNLFPNSISQTPIPPSITSFTPMIQPRSSDGQRLLYKYPDIPRVGVKGSYWLLVGTEDRSQAAYLLQFDGGANPNPGPASAGAVLWSPLGIDGKRNILFESGKYLGKATNNIAESQGLLLGLQIAFARGARELLIEGDSELIVYQNIRKYKVSDKNLKVWWSQAQAAMMDETAFDWIAIRQVPREQNERADSITKEVLIRKESFVR